PSDGAALGHRVIHRAHRRWDSARAADERGPPSLAPPWDAGPSPPTLRGAGSPLTPQAQVRHASLPLSDFLKLRSRSRVWGMEQLLDYGDPSIRGTNCWERDCLIPQPPFTTTSLRFLLVMGVSKVIDY